MAKKPSFRGTKNIRAQLRIDPRSLEEHNRKLRQLREAVREEVVRKALRAGGLVIQSAANAKAPGPHIVVKVLKGSELLKGFKNAKDIKPDGLYVAIGPDKQHWYYRFAEYGVKDHGVTKRKRTRYQTHLRKQGIKISKARKMVTGAKMKRTTGSTRPAMVFNIDGKLIFTRKVKGFPAKPFLKPAAQQQADAAIKAIGIVLKSEIEKAAKS